MRLIVMTRAQAEATEVPGSVAYISIHDSDQPPAALPLTSEDIPVLTLGFDDVLDGGSQGREIVAFDHALARTVLDFVDAVRNDVDTLVVHCNGGQCRSPAVAAALSKIEIDDDEIWFRTKRPNNLVYRTILEEYHAPSDPDLELEEHVVARGPAGP